MKTEKFDFDCAKEEFIIDLEKAGKISDFFYHKILNDDEKIIKQYILDKSIDFVVTDPIGDEQFGNDNSNCSNQMPDLKPELFINFTVFESLVSNHLSQGYIEMKIIFLELPSLLDTAFQEMLSREKILMENVGGYLYALLSFKRSSTETPLSYLAFNVDEAKLIDTDGIDYEYEFIQSSLGIALKAASKDKYTPSSIKYDLTKVKKYIDRIKMYLIGCKQKNVLRIDFKPCLGMRKHERHGNIESFYLSSIPSDNAKTPLNAYFPYYDQGSLEP